MADGKLRKKDEYPYVPVVREKSGMHVDPPRQARMGTKAKTTPALTARRPEMETQPSVPVKAIGKGKALLRIEDAGLSRDAFSSALDVMVTSGMIQKQGQAFLIPESVVATYIENSKED